MNSLLDVSRELAAIAQAGLAYSKDPFDIERFSRVRILAGLVLQAGAAVPEFLWPDELGYPTPKVDVRGAIFQDGKVLLIREKSSGLWTLPGGWADVNLTAKENVEKECLEESGYSVAATRITGLIDRDRAGYPRNAHSIYKIFFLCSILGGEATPGVESSHVGFFPVSELPELDSHRVRAEDIRHAFEVFNGRSADILFN